NDENTEIKTANLRGAADSGRIASANSSHLRFRNYRSAGTFIRVALLIIGRPPLQHLNSRCGPNDHVRAFLHRGSIRQVRRVKPWLVGKPRYLEPGLTGFHGYDAE